jgi:hypothetical protein
VSNGKVRALKQQPTPPNPFTEIGASGLEHWQGRVTQEFLRELRDERGRKMFREMWDNDPIIGAAGQTILQYMRRVSVWVETSGSTQDDERAKMLVTTALDDMSLTWSDTLSEWLTFLPFGWDYSEIVYKRREGESRDPTRNSRYNDGLIGWRKFAPRAQESLDRWELDDTGGVQGMWQRPAPDYVLRFIPIERALLFRTQANRGNPEGRSILRNAFINYFFVRRLREIEVIGTDRDLTGLPVLRAPADVLSDSATGEKAATRDALRRMGRNLKRDEQECALIPSDRDPDSGQLLFDLSLLTSPGRGRSDIQATITRLSREMAMSMFADFLFLGHENVGSFALVSARTSVFALALAGYYDALLATFNRHAIPRLIRLNGLNVTAMPTLKRGDIETPNLQELGQYITALANANALSPLFMEGPLLNRLLGYAGLPIEQDEGEGEVGKRQPLARMIRAELRGGRL